MAAFVMIYSVDRNKRPRSLLVTLTNNDIVHSCVKIHRTWFDQRPRLSLENGKGMRKGERGGERM